MKRPHVKICCIKSIKEAKLAIEHGASAIGLVSSMPSGPGVIHESEIANIAKHIGSDVETFLLTSQKTVQGIVSQHQRCATSTIQLCDHLSEESHCELKKQLPNISLVQVIHVENEKSIEYALSITSNLDALLLDSGSPEKAELGGTGKIHDWSISKEICERAPIPVYLAGGLRASNVKKALEIVNPYGLDLCSGVRTNDVLDAQKLKPFFEAFDGSWRLSDI